jgi:hypothetical protein
MPFTRFTTPVNNVSLQPDKPTITASELKAVFDKAGVDIAGFLNSGSNNLFGQLEASTAASNIGIGTISGLTGSNVYALISDLYTKLTASGSIPTARLADGSVTADKLATDSVTTSKILNSNVTTDKIANGNVTEIKIANNAVTTNKIGDGNVTNAKLADNSVTGAKIVNGTISQVELDATLSGKIDTIATNTSAIATVANDLTIHKSSGDHDPRYYTKTQLDGGQLDNRYYTESEIDSKVSSDYGAIATLNNVSNPAGNINFIGGTGITITASDSLNEIEITATGTSIPGVHGYTHAWDSTIDPLPSQSINTAQLVDLSVTNEKLDENAVETFNIADENVTTEKIANMAVTNDKIADLNVTTSKLADNSVTSGKIVNGTIINEDINSAAAIDATKIASGNVDNTEFGYLNGVTSAIQGQINNKLDVSGGTITGSLTINNNLNLITNGRIIGDFSSSGNARTMIQTNQTNGTTFFQIIPNGTNTNSHSRVFNNSDAANASYTGIEATATASTLRSSIFGTGTQLPLAFVVGTTEVARAHTNNNFGIGTTTPTEKLDVNGTIKSTGLNASGNSILSGTSAQSTTIDYGATRTISVKNFDANNVVLDTSENGYNYIGTSAKRFWRGYFNTLDATTVDADTYVGLPVATTSLSGIVSTGTQTFAGSKTFNSALSLNGDNRASGTTGSRVHNFYNTATSSIAGGITITGSATVTYGQGSDYRLKENFEPLTGALNKLLSIPVYKFSWKSEPEKGKVDGFIAHEVQAIVPEAIIGQKDAVDEEGNPIYQQIDQSKLVPLLFKAVQELSLKVEALEARIQSLESGDK